MRCIVLLSFLLKSEADFWNAIRTFWTTIFITILEVNKNRDYPNNLRCCENYLAVLQPNTVHITGFLCLPYISYSTTSIYRIVYHITIYNLIITSWPATCLGQSGDCPHYITLYRCWVSLHLTASKLFAPHCQGRTWAVGQPKDFVWLCILIK